MSNQLIKPNFFIIGAIKSGTTWLAKQLYEHPEVYMPGVWEPEFYAKDLTFNALSGSNNEQEYYDLFTNAKEYKAIGEKSVFYLYSKIAPKLISTDISDAKLLCILRNPVDLIWSLYRYNLSNLEEDELVFEKALEKEVSRKQGVGIPKTTTIVQNLFYRDVVMFGDQIERYYSFFDKSQIKIFLFDDFLSSPENVYSEAIEFLGLENMILPPANKVNEGEKYLTHIGIRRFLVEHPSIKNMVNKSIPLDMRYKLKKFYNILKGGDPSTLQTMNKNTSAALKNEIKPQITKLEQFIDRDLSHWYR